MRGNDLEMLDTHLLSTTYGGSFQGHHCGQSLAIYTLDFTAGTTWILDFSSLSIALTGI